LFIEHGQLVVESLRACEFLKQDESSTVPDTGNGQVKDLSYEFLQTLSATLPQITARCQPLAEYNRPESIPESRIFPFILPTSLSQPYAEPIESLKLASQINPIGR